MTRKIEDMINPRSVTMTRGTYQIETIPQIQGNGLIITAKREKLVAMIAAVFFPFVTAIVLMLCL